ncbi:MAG TPA: cytochrome b/b6 domain-containing protein [Usitatibacter sp.]
MIEAGERIRVWDLPTRIFHGALAALVVFSFATGKVGGGWMEWHVKSGCTILTLLVFRLAWGIVGSRTSRFTGFVTGPRAAIRYARETFAKRHPFTPGHNPLGGWMVVFMIAILLLQAATGLFADDEIATQGPLAAKVSDALVSRLTTIHKYNVWLIAAAVGLHLVAVSTYQWGLKVDLIGPMVHGWKRVPAGLSPAEPTRASPILALVVLGAAAAAVYALVVIYPR